MRLISIRLKNIKSHQDREIFFAPGINVLSGPNGVGKSTIFEAVGYALFGVDARDFVSNVERFLSIGAKRGEISVTFAAAREQTWRVTRTVGTPSTWRLARERDGEFETEDHANAGETEERIRELLGLAPGRPLAEQFKLVIGPFQHDFLGPFILRQQTKRKEVFDEILGIDSWRKTFDGTKELGSIIKGTISVREAELLARNERVALLPGRREEDAALAAEELAKQAELEAETARLAEAGCLLERLEVEKQAIELLRQDLLRIEESLRSGNEYVATQRNLVEQAEAAVRVLEETRSGNERFLATEKLLAELREQEKTRNTLERELAELAHGAAAARQAADHEERESVAEERRLAEERELLAREAEELQKTSDILRGREESLQRAVVALRSRAEAFDTLRLRSVSEHIPYLNVIFDRLQELELLVSVKKEAVAAEMEWQGKASQLDPLRTERDGVVEERARLAAQMAGITDGVEKLRDGVCPFFLEPCGNLQGKGGLGPFAGRRHELEALAVAAEQSLRELDVRIAAAQAAALELGRIAATRAELAALERERDEREGELTRRLEELDMARAVAEARQWAKDSGGGELPGGAGAIDAPVLAGAPVERMTALRTWESACRDVMDQLQSSLGRERAEKEESLGATRAEGARLEALTDELKRRETVLAASAERTEERKKKAAGHRVAAADAERECREKRETLAAFAGVEAAIAQAEASRVASREDHERFLQAEPAAAELQRRKETLSRYRDRLAELGAGRLAKGEQLAAREKEYSPDAHEAAQAARESAQVRGAALGERLLNLADNRRRLAAEIVELERVEVEVGNLREEIAALRKKEDVVKFLRTRVFRNVSAHLSERFREEISVRADAIYRTIAEADEELAWGDNYQIVLRDLVEGGVRERTDDQLSGGQMMSAVVALRLALLQTTGARLAFFDEPTSNLDAARRENLARAFRAIDSGRDEVTEHWYDQLFLISHDLSFTEITDQIIDLSR